MIPFEWWPGSWGLKGKTREIAKAEYELSGYELETKLAEINNRGNDIAYQKALLEIDLNYNRISNHEYDTRLINLSYSPDSPEYKRQKLNADWHHKTIDEYTYDKGIAELIESDKTRQLSLLEVEMKHEKITVQEYERRKADINGEPWIAMPKISWDPINPSKTYFELDYNEQFIEFLRENGYQGSDDDCINRWLNDVCFSVLQDMEQPEPELVSTIRKIRLPDGKTEHS